MQGSPGALKIKRTFAISIAVQSFGTVATFLTIALIATLAGPEAQGVYAQTRGWVDLMIVVGAFGFPSAIIYALNRLQFGVHRLSSAAGKYALGLVLPMAAATAVGIWWGALGAVDAPIVTVCCLALAGAAGVLHMLWRSMYLTFDDGTRFALFTILPNVSIMVAVVATLQRGDGGFELAFLGAYSVVFVVAYAVLRRALTHAPRSHDDRPLPMGQLAAYGLHQMLQGFLATGQVVGLYWLIRWAGGDDADIGLANMALQAFFGVTVPVNMIVPILLNRWTRMDEKGLFAVARALLRAGVPIALLSAPVLAVLAYFAIPGVFGEGFRRAALPAAILALAVVPAFSVRINSAAFQAAGRPEIMTWLSMLRVGLSAGAFVLLEREGLDLILASALGWGVGEVLGALAADHAQRRIERGQGIPFQKGRNAAMEASRVNDIR